MADEDPKDYQPRMPGRAFVVGWKVATKRGRFGWDSQIIAPAHAADQRHQKQKGTNISRNRIAGQAEDVHAAEPAVHQRTAGPHRDFPERQIHAFGGKGFVNEIVFANRCAARGDENIRREITRLANGGNGRFELVGHQAEIGE